MEFTGGQGETTPDPAQQRRTDVSASLTRLVELVGQAGGAEATRQAAALAEAQRVSGSGLRAAIALARQSGVSWRELASLLDVSATTLHRQYRSGRGLMAVRQDQPDAARPLAQDDSSNDADVLGADPLRAGVSASLANLPAIGLDRFLGRTRELADLPKLLAQARLLVLTGTAGVGKTRLAAELVRRIRRSYRGGVWWVALSPLADVDPITPAILAAAGLREEPGRPEEEVFAGACGPGRALLVIDNCEHVVQEVAQLVHQLLAACPRLRVLATSREALRIRGEVVFPVSLLPLPPRDPTDLAEIRRSDAVRLFVDRTRTVAPDFELSDEWAPVVANVCISLDGLPLAIELAARQIPLLSPASLLSRLDHPLDLLAGGTRDALPRQQSLRAAIEWSYRLLGKDEQAVFRRLALMPGGFDLEGAGALCADVEPDPTALWCILGGLARKSMLVPDTTRPTAEVRFRILESLRAFGIEHLQAAHELTHTQELLMTWLSDRARALLSEPSPPMSLRRWLSQERFNLRYAIKVAEEEQDDRYPLLASALAADWFLHGEIQQARSLLMRVLAHEPCSSLVRIFALTELAFLLRSQGDYSTAKIRAEEALDLCRRRGVHVLSLRARRELVVAHVGLGNGPVAVELKREEVQILRSRGPSIALAESLAGLAWDLMVNGAFESAEEALAEAMELLDIHSDTPWLAPTLHTAGALGLVRGQLDQASARFSTALATPLADIKNIAYNVEGLGLVASRRGELERALRLIAAAATIRAAEGLPADPWWSSLLKEATSAARGMLPEWQVEAARAQGAELTPDRAVTYALNDELPRLPDRSQLRTLTPREYEVASLVTQGLTNAQVAARLGIAVRTVAGHLTNMRTKLDLPTRAHVIAWVAGQQNVSDN